jgi:hypothetical protein
MIWFLFDCGVDYDDALAFGGHSFVIVEVYFSMLKDSLGLVWFFTLLLSLVIQVKVVLDKAR